MAILELQDVDAYYGNIHILRGVSLTVPENQVTALLGRNGVGKSTALKSVMGLTQVRSGSITFAGTSVAGMRTDEIARLGLGYVPEDRRIFTTMTILDNLTVGYRGAKGDLEQNLNRVFALFPVLHQKRKHYGDQMSGGEQQMLAIARCLMTEPALLMLDEPCEGLAPAIVKDLGQSLERLLADGLSILLVEQSLRLAQSFATQASVLNKGQVCYTGKIADLLGDSDLMKQHLGLMA